MKNFFIHLKKDMHIPLIISYFLILALILGSITTILPNYFDLITSKDILKLDFLEFGLNSVLLNVSINLLINFIFIKLLKLRVTGPIFVGLFLNVAFSFCGITILNFLPMYLGVFIHALLRKVHFRNLIIPTLSSCGIAPIVSFIAFGIGLPVIFGLLLGILIGIVLGLIIPAIASHVIIFHSGYNLYNLGFTLGLLSVILSGFLNLLNIEYTFTVNAVNEFNNHFYFIFITMAIMFILIGSLKFKESFKNYKKLLTRSGRLVQDFIRDYGVDAVCLNIGINLLVVVFVLFILQIPVTGLVVAAVFTVISFSAMGKHVRNIVPVIIGAIIAALIMGYKGDNTVSAAIIFSTTLAPLSGRYKFIIGIVAGFLHVIIIPQIVDFQGPFNLFTNGLTGGIIAAILISIIESYEKEFK